jgi:hypothetical protein
MTSDTLEAHLKMAEALADGLFDMADEDEAVALATTLLGGIAGFLSQTEGLPAMLKHLEDLAQEAKDYDYN